MTPLISRGELEGGIYLFMHSAEHWATYFEYAKPDDQIT